MDVNIPEDLARAIGGEALEPYGFREDQLRWQRYVTIGLDRLSPKQVAELRALVEPHREIRGAGVALRDIDVWLASLREPGALKIRKVEHMTEALSDYLYGAPGHRLYEKADAEGTAYVCYLATSVEFVEERRDGGYVHPAHVVLSLVFDKFGSRKGRLVEFYHKDVAGKTVREALAHKGFFVETPDLREAYLRDEARYAQLMVQVGAQFLVNGYGERAGVPGNSDYDRTIVRFADSADVRNRVVVDVFVEPKDESRGREREEHYDLGEYFWQRVGNEIIKRRGGKVDDPAADQELVEKREEGQTKWSRTRKGLPVEDLQEAPAITDVPVHPYLVVFDLQRHARLSVHSKFMREYVYDRNLADKLILPDELKQLVRMLVEQRGAFKDIVAGKAGGTIILLTGAPGLGKTLTAEVFAEAEGKPLYSVQASQLGTEAKELEHALMEVLQRASRWGAVLLLDEADVYVHERGDSLEQNAIVGVFLRVLEYYTSVLFLTTNRPDLVDDAIASRCVARIDYPYPTPEDQRRIWEVLCGMSGIRPEPGAVEAFVREHKSGVSGRDVKNLLKLADLMSRTSGKPIDAETLEYVLRFKPTVSKDGGPRA